MGDEANGDDASVNWSFAAKQPHLPPKSPSFPNMGSTLPTDNDGSNVAFSSFCSFPYSKQHQRTPSANLHLSRDFPWIDDDLVAGALESVSKRGFHRRSSSDSAAFLDNSGRVGCMEEDEMSAASIVSRGSQDFEKDFEKLDEEQLMSMFADIEPFPKPKNLPPPETSMVEKRTPLAEHSATPSDQNSFDESFEENGTGSFGDCKGESEVQSDHNNNGFHTRALQGEPTSRTVLTEPDIEPKRAKRILANRLSAQRSRVRKLQYISELERSINALQAEVSTLSPQVAYLDHHRVVLNVDNSALKQRMAALAQDKLFKDAHSEALKKEVHRLRQIYFEIRQQEMNKLSMDNTMQHANSNFEFCESNLEKMKCGQDVTNENGHNSSENISHSRPPIVNAIGNGKDLEGRMLSASAPVHSDFFL